MRLTVQSVATYKGHSLRENGNVDLTLKFRYDELVKTIQLMQMLNNDVVISAKLPDVKGLKLGMFRIKHISIDDDGESVVKLNSLNDYVEVDNLNNLVTKEAFKVRFEAEIESEQNEE